MDPLSWFMQVEDQVSGLPARAEGYQEFLGALKERIRAAQVRAVLGVNQELLSLYWRIGRDILTRQRDLGWGAKVIAQIADDLRREFPRLKGFSQRNLRYMRDFAKAWPDETIWQELLPNCPWHHHCIVMDKVRDQAERAWYLRAAAQQGWSGSLLVHQIETGLCHRQGRALSNFEATLPAPQSDLARQIIKDPYCFDFLGLGPEAHERELHEALLDHLRDFLIELGVGFSFAGSRVHLEVGGQDFYLDLLFYHLRLRCFVVVELKTVDFQPEFVGKLNFYLSAVDDLMCHPTDQPTIGILLCKTKSGIVAEYALRDLGKPIGVSTFRLADALPEELKAGMPTIEQLEEGLRVRTGGLRGV